MTLLTCAAARRRLSALYDRELPIGDQIAVAAHLESCAGCAEALADLQLVGDSLRAVAPGHPRLSRDEESGFHSGVVNRMKAECEASFVARVRGMFEDLHLVYAGLGAAAATMACVVIMLSMMRFATNERPDSLAAMVAFLATPGSSANAVSIDAASHARWTARFEAANETAEEDAVFALDAVVTRGGRITLEHLGASRRGAAPAGSGAVNDAKLIEGLLDAVSRARFDPSGDGSPTAAGMVWLITQTTVRASQSPNNLDQPLPAAKKRAASLSSARSRIVVA